MIPIIMMIIIMAMVGRGYDGDHGEHIGDHHVVIKMEE